MSEAPLDLSGRSILIFDSGLRSLDGHWYEYDRAVAEIHLARGSRVTLVCHREFPGSAALEDAGAKVVPAIGQSIWTGYGLGAGRLGELRGLLSHARYLARVARRHLAERDHDLVFVPNATIFDALAWAMLLRSGRAGRAPRLVLLFRFSIPGVDPTLAEPVARKFFVWRMIFRSLRDHVASGHVAFVTDSLRLVAQYAAVAGVELTVVPSPRTLPARKVAGPPSPARQLTFAMLGYARWARGIDLFEQAIVRLLQSGRADGMRFILQWHVAVVRPDGSVHERDPLLAASDQVVLIDRPLASDAYDRLFEEIDCMVLPYRRQDYHSQISGVAIEAACSGIPMIFTDDTWLSDYVADQAAGIAVPENDVAALADAIAELAANYPDHAEAARIRSERARACNTPDEFLRLLWNGHAGAPVEARAA